MRRGTTPVLTVGVNTDLTDQTIFVTIRQNPDVLIEKTGDDVLYENGEVKVQLTQEETLSMRKGSAEIQVRCINADGIADASNIGRITVEDVLKDGEIEYAET